METLRDTHTHTRAAHTLAAGMVQSDADRIVCVCVFVVVTAVVCSASGIDDLSLDVFFFLASFTIRPPGWDGHGRGSSGGKV